jgi:hypothetical protein
MALICERMEQGESLRAICREEGMPHISNVLRWIADDAALREQYACAREALADHYAEAIIDISDRSDLDPNDKRVRMDARKWVASKMAPKRYGDRTELELGGKGPAGEITTTLLVTGVVRAGD